MRSAGRDLDVFSGQAIEHGEIELGVVYRVGGIARGRPSQPRRLLARGAFIELVKAGQASLGSAQHLQRVERGHTRPSLVEVDARKRKQHAMARRARGEMQSEAFRGDAVLLEIEIGAETNASCCGRAQFL